MTNPEQSLNSPSDFPSTVPHSTTPETETESPLPEGWSDRRNRSKHSSGKYFAVNESHSKRSQFLLNVFGYGLLVLAGLDVLSIVIPPQLTNPAWELQTIGQLVERVPVFLLGFIAVFYRYSGQIRRSEMLILKGLSWLALVIGVIYYLMLPLGISNTFRIDAQNQTQVSAQLSQQQERFQVLKQELEKATTDAEVQRLVGALAQQNTLPNLENPQQLKENLLNRMDIVEQNIQAQAKATRSNQRKVLFKDSVKWNLGALISGTLFLWVWYLTEWVRKAR